MNQQREPIRNGKPNLPYSRQTISKADREAVLNALDSPHIAGNGPLTQQFEESLAEYTGYRYAVAVANGSCALHLAYLCARMLRGLTCIVTTPLTFIATASAAIHANLNVVLGDINEHTYVLDTKSAYRTPVSYAGYPANDAYISDDCHYIVRNMASRNIDISVGSGHPVKPIACGEMGWLLTNDFEAASYCRQLRDHGRVDGKAIVPGFNYRVSDILCALGISQLRRLDESLERRKQIASTYYEHWRDDSRIVLPANHDRHGWHLFVVRVKNRERFRELLLNEGVQTQWHYPLVQNLPIFANTDRIAIDARVDLKKQNEIGSQIVSIPLFAGMSDDDTNDVIMAVDMALDIMENENGE